MFGKCKHQWETTNVTHVPGATERGASFKFGGGRFSDAAGDALYGYTIIGLHCTRCGNVKTGKVRGKYDPPAPK